MKTGGGRHVGVSGLGVLPFVGGGLGNKEDPRKDVFMAVAGFPLTLVRSEGGGGNCWSGGLLGKGGAKVGTGATE